MTLQVGVKALIQNTQGEFLFLKRNPELYTDNNTQWDIPGGRIQADEYLLSGLEREIFEETGLHLKKSHAQIIAAQDIFVTHKNIHVVRLTYIAAATGEIRLSEEHTNFAWMTKETALDSGVDPYVHNVLLDIK